MQKATNKILEARARLLKAEAFRQQGQFDRARAICEALVREHPNYVGALYALGLVLARAEDFYGALGCLVRASNLNPKDARVQAALGEVYFKLGWNKTAARTLEAALKVNPSDTESLLTLGQICWDEKEFEAAADIFERAVTVEPSSTEFRRGLAESYFHLGEFEKAAQGLEALFNDGNRTFAVCRLLGALPESLVTIDLLAAIETLDPPNEEEREAFESARAFVEASALHRSGQFPKAWERMVAANAYRKKLVPSDYAKAPEVRALDLARMKEERDKPAIRGETDDSVPQSLVILGPSRAGKTTMERLVGSFNGVKRGFESNIVANAVARTFQTAGLLTRARMREMDPEMWDLFREFYREELAERAGTSRIFTNTMPGLITDAVLIARIVPNARFIFVKRNIDDVTIRTYMKPYKGERHGYAYSVDSIYSLIEWYYKMIDVIAELLPDLSRIIHYEDMIEDPKAALDIACEVCGVALYTGDLPELGDDRGAGAPYKEYLEATLAASRPQPLVERA